MTKITEDEDRRHDNQRFELEGFGMKLRSPSKRATEVISVLLAGCVLFIGLVLYQHNTEAKDNSYRLENALVESNKKTVEAIEKLGWRQEQLLRAILNESREQTCLQRFEPEERKGQESFCKNIGRQIGSGGGP